MVYEENNEMKFETTNSITSNDLSASQAMEAAKRKAEALDIDINSEIVLPFESMIERAKYIPLRLTYEERKVLRLVNACITVSGIKIIL